MAVIGKQSNRDMVILRNILYFLQCALKVPTKAMPVIAWTSTFHQKNVNHPIALCKKRPFPDGGMFNFGS